MLFMAGRALTCIKVSRPAPGNMSYSYTYNTLLPKAARRRMLPVTMASTLLDKLWALHCVADLGDGESLLNIDRVFLHERTGSGKLP